MDTSHHQERATPPEETEPLGNNKIKTKKRGMWRRDQSTPHPYFSRTLGSASPILSTVNQPALPTLCPMPLCQNQTTARAPALTPSPSPQGSRVKSKPSSPTHGYQTAAYPRAHHHQPHLSKSSSLHLPSAPRGLEACLLGDCIQTTYYYPTRSCRWE